MSSAQRPEERKSRIQAAEIVSVYRESGLSLRDRVRSWNVRREIGEETLIVHVERSQLM